MDVQAGTITIGDAASRTFKETNQAMLSRCMNVAKKIVDQVRYRCVAAIDTYVRAFIKDDPCSMGDLAAIMTSFRDANADCSKVVKVSAAIKEEAAFAAQEVCLPLLACFGDHMTDTATKERFNDCAVVLQRVPDDTSAWEMIFDTLLDDEMNLRDQASKLGQAISFWKDGDFRWSHHQHFIAEKLQPQFRTQLNELMENEMFDFMATLLPGTEEWRKVDNSGPATVKFLPVSLEANPEFRHAAAKHVPARDVQDRIMATATACNFPLTVAHVTALGRVDAARIAFAKFVSAWEASKEAGCIHIVNEEQEPYYVMFVTYLELDLFITFKTALALGFALVSCR